MAETTKIQWTHHTMADSVDTQLPSPATLHCHRIALAHHCNGCTTCPEQHPFGDCDRLPVSGCGHKFHTALCRFAVIGQLQDRFDSEMQSPYSTRMACMRMQGRWIETYLSRRLSSGAMICSSSTTHPRVLCGVPTLQECNQFYQRPA